VTTDWAALSHAYGGAEDVPDMLDALRKGDAEQAAHELWASVLHQGSLYDATAPAVAEICTVLTNRTKVRVEQAGWLVASAVAAAHANPPDEPHVAAVLAAAEPAWRWAKRTITQKRTAEIAAEVLAVHRDRTAEALALLTDAAARWPDRPVFLKAIHALDPASPVLTRALDDPDADLAATAAVMLISSFGGPPADAFGERLTDAALRVLAARPLETDLPDTPVKLIMTAVTGVDPQFTEPEYPHRPSAASTRLIAGLLDSPAAVDETAVALTQRNIARSRGVADWATDLITARIGAEPLMDAAYHLGPRLAGAADRIAAVDWAPGSMAGGFAAAILARLESHRDQLPEWLDRGWGHPDLAHAFAGPLTDGVADAIAGRLGGLGVPEDRPRSFDKPWHVSTLEHTTHALRNNEFIAWQAVLVRGGPYANERLAEVRAEWPAAAPGLSPTLRAEHLRALGQDPRDWLIERVRLGHQHGLDIDRLRAWPADPDVVAAAGLGPDDYVDSSLIELAGWVAEHSTWDPSALFAVGASQPWPAITMLGLRAHGFADQVAAAVPTVAAALHKPGQSPAAALVLRPGELSPKDAAVRADVLARMATRLPDRSEKACAVLAVEPDTLATIAGRLRSWRDGDELFDALPMNASAGFTDAEVTVRINALLGDA
jgi:hypothetical protein